MSRKKHGTGIQFALVNLMARKGVLKKYRVARNCILFMVVGMLATPLFATPKPMLPLDRNIGQIVEIQDGSVEERGLQALSESYSLSWIESYVPSSMRTGFVYTYDRILASHLPLQQLQIAQAIQRGHLYEVPFCYHEPTYGYGSTTWMKNEDGAFVLLSFTLDE